MTRHAYLRVMCGPVQVLVPADCVSGVAPRAAAPRPLPPARRMPREAAVLDGRRWFGLPATGDGVAVAWHSLDNAHAATILADGAVWHDDAGGLPEYPLPRLPALAARLFDGVVVDGDVLIPRLRPDAAPRRDMLRRVRQAAVEGAEP